MEVPARSTSENAGVNVPTIVEIRPAIGSAAASFPDPLSIRIDHHYGSKPLRLVDDLGDRPHRFGCGGPHRFRHMRHRDWFLSDAFR